MVVVIIDAVQGSVETSGVSGNDVCSLNPVDQHDENSFRLPSLYTENPPSRRLQLSSPPKVLYRVTSLSLDAYNAAAMKSQLELRERTPLESMTWWKRCFYRLRCVV